MKVSKKKENGNAGNAVKPQKTLFHFFQRQASTSTQVEKVTCPACSTEVAKSKINWHLDQDCKSKEKKSQKKQRGTPVNRKGTKSTKKTSKKKAMLSDSEDEDDDNDLVVIESKNGNGEGSSSDDFFIDPSMVEVQMNEDDNANDLHTPTKTQDKKDMVSPYFSGTSSASKFTPGKRKEKIINSHIPKIENSAIAQLQTDWDSPQTTPVKTEKSDVLQVQAPGSSKCCGSPQTIAAKAVKKMLEEDWDLISPATSPQKEVKKSKTSSNKKQSPKKYHEPTSDEEFEENTIVFRTPIKPKSSSKKKKSPEKVQRELDMEREKAHSILKSPASSQHSSALGSESDSIPLFSPVRSPGLVSPMRSPTPSPECKSLNPVRKLFTPSQSPQLTPESSPEATPTKLKLSPQINSNIHRFNRINRALTSSEDAFDALAQNSSQKNTSPSKSPGKLIVRTPRKINQSIKNLGLLQNSSQSSLHVIKATNKKSPSFSSNISESQDAESTNTFKDEIQGGISQSDPAKFRDKKGYYLDNFLRILDTVLSEPQDVKLFNEDDLGVVRTFKGLSLSAQKLYVRLFQRKIKWNRVTKIEYKDICDQEDTELYVNELIYANLLLKETDMNGAEEVLSMLSNEELHGLCKQMKISASGKKEDLISSLVKFTKQQKSIMTAFKKTKNEDSIVLKRAKVIIGRCCLVNKEMRRVFMRILMLYGLPRYDEEEEGGQQSQLTTLLMVNMGKMEFPQYEVVRKHSIFRARDDLLRYETCNQILNDVQECMESQKWEEALQHCQLAATTYQELISDEQLMTHEKTLPSFLRRFTSVSILIYILTCSVECHQRLRSYQKAVKQLQDLLEQKTHLQDYRGRWFDRLALNLATHLKKPAEAVTVINEALNDPEVRKGHRLALSIRAQRMGASARYKSLAATIAQMPIMNPKEAPKVIIEGRSLPGDIPGYKRAFIRQDSARHAGEGEVTVCSVEELVLGHYKDQGYTEGLHREGATVNSLFALYFWEALYSSVPDVFRSPYQASPLDLDDPNFYVTRKQIIDQRLNDMRKWSEEEAANELEKVWTEHYGQVSLVAWDLFRNSDHAKSLVASLGTNILAALCERLAKDHRFTRSGFPDLVVWDPVNKKCRIVEVKGPNDRLSTKQILWLEYLLDCGATAEVCHVEAIGAKKMKKASPRKISPKKATPEKSSPEKPSPMKTRRGKRAKCDNAEDDRNEGTKVKRRKKTGSEPASKHRKAIQKENDSDDFEEPVSTKKTRKGT